MPALPKALAQGLRHHQRGQFGPAEQSYREVLRDDPQHPDALHLLGVVFYQTGRHHEAIELIGRAIEVKPNVADFHSNLGAAELALGRIDEAIASCKRALLLQPDFPQGHNNLGSALSRAGDLTNAIAHYEAALRLRPDYAEAHKNLGIALANSDRLDEAVLCFRKALALHAADAEIHNCLGSALTLLSRPEEARHHLRESLRLNPEHPEAHNGLGAVLVELGQPDDALLHFKDAVRLKPDYALAWSNLGHLAAQRHYSFSDAEIEHMRSLLDEERLASDDTIYVHFTLAAIHDRRRDHDTAFEHYRQANQARRLYFERKNMAFDPDAFRDVVDRMISTFDLTWFEHSSGSGVESELPVFIVGMPRSGTTLVEQILATHPEVFGAGELEDIQQIARELPQSLDTADEYPECMAAADHDTLRTTAERHLHRLRSLGGEATRVIEKLPRNFMHLGLIHTLFPRARVIHCRRNALDVCLSCYFQDFRSQPFASSLEDLGAYYCQYERMMAHWRNVLPMRMYEIVYEELVTDQAAAIPGLLEFCGVEWTDRCLAFHETPRTVRTASRLQVRRPIYSTSVGRSKPYRRHLKPLIDALGKYAKCNP